jgi:head-tail adaptor
MKKPETGELDRRIVIARVERNNVAGIAKKVTQEIATVWAKFNQLAVKDWETYTKEQTQTIANFEFVIRWSKVVRNIRAKDVIYFAGSESATQKRYEIVESPVEIGRREFISIKARLNDANA